MLLMQNKKRLIQHMDPLDQSVTEYTWVWPLDLYIGSFSSAG